MTAIRPIAVARQRYTQRLVMTQSGRQLYFDLDIHCLRGIHTPFPLCLGRLGKIHAAARRCQTLDCAAHKGMGTRFQDLLIR